MPLPPRALLPLLPCLVSAYALHLPAVRPRVAEAKVDRRPNLIAQASELPAPTTTEPIISGTSSGAVQVAATTTGSVVAGIYSGIMQFTFATACASIVFVPVGLPVSIGIQHCLIGYFIMQAVVAKTNSLREGVVLLSPSFEVLPFLSKFAMIVAGAVGTSAAPGAVLATVLAGSVLCNLMSAALLAMASELPVDDINSLLPPPLQAGLFAAIGWSLYLLAFDTLGLSFTARALFTRSAARLWVPANVLGLGLWGTSRKTDSPLLFPIFILAVTALVHGVRLGTGTSVLASRGAGWLMAEAAGQPVNALWRSFSPSLIRWDILRSAAALKQLVCAALFGPLVNTVLNYVLYGPMIKEKLDLKKELRSHAVGSVAGAAVGGYPNYIGLSDSAIHRKMGGLDRRSCYIASAVAGLFLLAYPLCGVVGYLPTLVIAGVLVFVGCDFMYDNLFEATQASGAKAGLVAAAVFAVCVQQDMLLGSVLGIAGAQLHGWWKRRSASNSEQDAS